VKRANHVTAYIIYYISGSAFDGRLDPDPGGLKREKKKGKNAVK
jgi:hypothetical protein